MPLDERTPFLKTLDALLVAARWQSFPTLNRWRHEEAGLEARLLGGQKLQLSRGGSPWRYPASKRRPADAAYHVATQLEAAVNEVRRAQSLAVAAITAEIVDPAH